MCDLVAGSERQWFEVELDPVVPRTRIAFSGAGLVRPANWAHERGRRRVHVRIASATDPARSPYRGLRALEPEDAGIFLGRDAALVRALDALRSMREQGVERILVVVGCLRRRQIFFLVRVLPRLERDYRRFCRSRWCVPLEGRSAARPDWPEPRDGVSHAQSADDAGRNSSPSSQSGLTPAARPAAPGARDRRS